jgi:regulatory protein YycI of two-component signal transduction system YycFG
MTFLLLDLVLGYQFWKLRTEQAGYVQSYAEQLTEVRDLLASQKWEIRTEVPRVTATLGYLHVRYLDAAEEEWKKRIVAGMVVKGSGQVTVDLTDKDISANLEDESMGDRLWTQLTPWVWPKELYKYDRTYEIGKGIGVVKYLQHFNGYPIFSAPIDVVIREEKATRYTQAALEVIREEGSKKQVISAVHALRSLSESIDKTAKSNDNKIIRDIRLGYYSKTYNADEWYLTPVWRVLTAQEVYYVNALTGEVELAR